MADDNVNFAELLKVMCDELIAQGEDISKYGNVVIDSIDSLAGKGYELELTQQGCDVQQVEFVEPKSYYTTYYGQDVAITGQARGYYRYIGDSHFGASGRSGRPLIVKSDYEVELI